MKRILLLASIVFSGLLVLEAQNTCSEQLRQSQINFDNGLLDDIPSQLEGCMKNGFTKEEKTNAYKLLIQTYLFSEQIEKADEVMTQFLSEFPSYDIAVNDPREFIDLYSTYRTDPIYNLEFLAGTNLCIPTLLFNRSVTDSNSDVNEYSPGLAVNMEANYINKLAGNFNYSVGLSYSFLRLGYYNEPNSYNYIEATFKSMVAGLPVGIRYDYNFKGIKLYGKVGIEPTYLVSYVSDITRTNKRGGDPIQEVKNLIDNHIRFDIMPFLGIGAKINLGRDELHIALAYKLGMVNQAPKENAFKDVLYLTKFFQPEDEKYLNAAVLSISYFRPIYKPKKLN